MSNFHVNNQDVMKLSMLTLWDKLVLFIFALVLFDSTEGFDTGLNSLLVVRVMSVSLRPQEILIILAVVYFLVNPRSITVLTKTAVGNLMTAMFLMVCFWTAIRVYDGETTNILLRTYFGWIAMPVALCVTLRKWEVAAMSFYMTLGAGFIGAFVMGAVAIMGADFAHSLFPGIVQRTSEAYSSHFGFHGQSYGWIQLLIFFVTASLLFAKNDKHRFRWGLFLAYLFGLDLVTMGRGRLIFNIVFLLFGLAFVSPKLEIHFRSAVQAGFVLLLLALVTFAAFACTDTFNQFADSLKTRYVGGLDEIKTRDGSFAKHYLAPFERIDLLKEEGLATLFIGAGPIKSSEINYSCDDNDNMTMFSSSEAREVNGDSSYATLLGWYGLIGVLLMMLLAIVSFKKYVVANGLDIRFRYAGAMAGVTLFAGGILVAQSSCAVETATLSLAWAAIIEFNIRQKAQMPPLPLKQPVKSFAGEQI